MPWVANVYTEPQDIVEIHSLWMYSNYAGMGHIVQKSTQLTRLFL